MKDIVKQSMMCALDGIENRKNTHEMYGYDFMIDENYKVWLIEINSSPSMDYSTVNIALLSMSLLNWSRRFSLISLKWSLITPMLQKKKKN